MFKPNQSPAKDASEAARGAAAVERWHTLENAYQRAESILRVQAEIGPRAYFGALEEQVSAAVGHIVAGVSDGIATEASQIRAEMQDAA